ncbi:MAG: DUF418 domain-containing protein [Deinococcales bacterium]
MPDPERPSSPLDEPATAFKQSIDKALDKEAFTEAFEGYLVSTETHQRASKTAQSPVFDEQLGYEVAHFEAEVFEPLAAEDRIKNLDILRGIALVGITLVNTLVFAYPQAYYGPFKFPSLSGLDKAVEWFILVFAKTAFYPLFSFLFGVGLAIQEARGLERFTTPYPFLRRRLFFLLLIGLIHGSFIWMGDILTLYALTGFIFLVLPKKDLKRSFIIVAVCLALAFGGLFAIRLLAGIFPSGLSARLLLNTYADGSFWAISQLKLKDFYYNFVLSAVYALPHVLAFMLLGYSVSQSSLLYIPEAHKLWLKRLILSALAIALVFKSPYVISISLGERSNILRYLAVILGGPALSAAYVGLILLALQNFRWRKLLNPFAPLGRMALSNYIGQSITFTLIYYSYGLGLYGQVSTFKAIMLALALVALQLLISKHWLQHFRYGPLEWLWRSLSYGKKQAFRLR